MNTINRILGESVRPPTEREQTDPYFAYRYARYVIGGRWPEAEAAIATKPEWAYHYARYVIEGRWPEGEPAIATDPYWAERYIKRFPEAKREWTMRGWLDWLDP